ncbi:MAG: DUF2911 domain-containing protein [bacterium]
MRTRLTTALLLGTGMLAGSTRTSAQSAILNLPRVSQHSRLTQRVGLTDITIDYHRPSVAGRKIFGGLQAWGDVWRAGANENTTFEVTDPVTIDGQLLPKGVYGLHMIPGEASWVVIFSRNSTSWGSFTYDKSEDALRVTVKPQTSENHEQLSYDFDDLTPSTARITMRWEKVAVPFTLKVNTADIAQLSLRNQLRSRAQFEWSPWMEAANYMLANKLSADEALKDADRSVEIEDRFENEITRSRALTVLGRTDQALAARNRAITLGTQSQVHDFCRGLQAQGRQEEALALFRVNIQKDPTSWIGHNDAARVAVAAGDFDKAVKEMELAVPKATETLKPQIVDLIRRLKNKEDINK